MALSDDEARRWLRRLVDDAAGDVRLGNHRQLCIRLMGAFRMLRKLGVDGPGLTEPYKGYQIVEVTDGKD